MHATANAPATSVAIPNALVGRGVVPIKSSEALRDSARRVATRIAISHRDYATGPQPMFTEADVDNISTSSTPCEILNTVRANALPVDQAM